MPRRPKNDPDAKFFQACGINYLPRPKSRDGSDGHTLGPEQMIRKHRNLLSDKTDLHNFDYPFENLVLSGGGGKGYAFVGGFKVLEECGVLQNLKGVAGSSVGSLCAGLVSVGCSAQEVADVFAVNVRWLFQDQTCGWCCCIPKMWTKFGLNPAKRFYRIYGEHIARKTGNADITFKELYEQRGMTLCIVVTNLNKMCSEYCHPLTTPNLPIRMAVRMSMSFPVVYQPVNYDLNETGELCWYTDGGMLDQYPIHCFDLPELELNHNAFGADKYSKNASFNPKTLGLYVVSESPIDYQIWEKLFARHVPYKPTYTPDTRLAKERLKDMHPKKKKVPTATLR